MAITRIINLCKRTQLTYSNNHKMLDWMGLSSAEGSYILYSCRLLAFFLLFYFGDEETKAQGGEVTWPDSYWLLG